MNFKKKIAIFFTALYSASMLGLALSIHFCAGELENVKFFESTNSCMLCKEVPDSKKADDCCKISNVSLKVEDSHRLGNKIDLPHFFATVLFERSPAVFVIQESFQSFTTFLNNKAPPLSAKISLHIFNCIFRN